LSHGARARAEAQLDRANARARYRELIDGLAT
jgi:hypothetical protein